MKLEELQVVQQSRSKLYFLNAVVVVIQLIQMFSYYNNNFRQDICKGILIIWGCSKLLCILIQFIMSQHTSFFHYIKITIRALILPEFLSLSEEMNRGDDILKSWMIGSILQIHVYALPIFIVNSYLIITEERNGGVDSFIYAIMIVDIILISFTNILIQSVRSNFEKIKQPLIFTAMSFCRTFLFWYILCQIYYLNQSLLISWVVSHIIISLFLLQQSNISENRFTYFMSYIFQLQLFVLRDNQNSQAKPYTCVTELTILQIQKKWYEIFYFLFLQLNIVWFIISKIAIQPILVKIDYLIYVLLPFLIPALMWTFEVMYNKLTKIENFNQTVGWNEGKYSFVQTVDYLRDHLLNRGNVEIEFDGIKNQQNQQKLNNLAPIQINNYLMKKQEFYGVDQIKQGLRIAQKGNFKNLDLEFYNKEKSMTLLYSFGSKTFKVQKLILLNEYNQNQVTEFLDIIQHIINPKQPLSFEGDKKDITKLRFNILRFNTVPILPQQTDLILKIAANNLSAFAFYQIISNSLPINPSLILYDLLEEAI